MQKSLNTDWDLEIRSSAMGKKVGGGRGQTSDRLYPWERSGAIDKPWCLVHSTFSDMHSKAIVLLGDEAVKGKKGINGGK